MAYLTIKQFCAHYPAFTESSIRWLIFNEKENGFCACVRRVGKKIIIDTQDFEEWMNKKRNE